MEIAFANKKLRDICEIQLEAERALGLIVAATLRTRLADLREVESIEKMPTGKPTIHDVRPPGRATVDLGERYCLTFTANHLANPISENGVLEWRLVSRIKIIEIGRDR